MGGKETLTWEEFYSACCEFEKLTENLDQNWQFLGQAVSHYHSQNLEIHRYKAMQQRR